MATIVIKSFPEDLHARLKVVAAAHRRSVTQETIHLLEIALSGEANLVLGTPTNGQSSYWERRRLLPEFEEALHGGAFAGGTDSTQGISDERDER